MQSNSKKSFAYDPLLLLQRHTNANRGLKQQPDHVVRLLLVLLTESTSLFREIGDSHRLSRTPIQRCSKSFPRCIEPSSGTLALILFVLRHPASAQVTKNWVAQLQAEVESKLSKEHIEAVEQSHFTKQLDEFVHHALDRI